MRPFVFAGLVVLLTAGSLQADWRNSSFQDYEAVRNERHPRRGTVALVLPVDARFGADVCFGYGNGREDKPQRGKVSVTVEITRQESPTGPVELVERTQIPTTRVSANVAGECTSVGLLEAGDLVTFAFRFKGLPRLQPARDAGRIQFHGNVVSRDCTEGPCVTGESR